MTTLHMETEQVREVARQMDQKALDLFLKEASLRFASRRLSGVWHSIKADSFLGNFNGQLSNFESQVRQLQELAMRLSREVDEWETTDSLGAKATREEYENRFSLWPDIGLWGSGGDAFSIISKLIKINPALDVVLGGFFSFMDDSDPNRGRALFGAFGPYAMLLIPGAGTVAFGVYETIMAANSAVQIGADLQVAGDEIWTNLFVSDPKMFLLYRDSTVTTGEYHDNAERIDLSNIPADIFRSIYDYAIQPSVTAVTDAWNNPSYDNLLHLGAVASSYMIGGIAGGTGVAYALDSSAQQAVVGDVGAVLNDAANFVVGVYQYPITYFEHNLSYGIAYLTVGTSYLPIPDEWKSPIIDFSTDMVHTINGLPELYDLLGLAKPRDY